MLSLLGSVLGFSAAPPPPARYAAAKRQWQPAELAAIKAAHAAAAGPSGAGALDRQQLLAMCGLAGAAGPLADGLFAAVAGCAVRGGDSAGETSAAGPPAAAPAALPPPPAGATLYDVVVAKTLCERASGEDAAGFAFLILGPDGHGLVARAKLAAIVADLLRLSLPAGLHPFDAAGSAAAIADGCVLLFCLHEFA
jgi:hypothetical protein